MICCYWSISTFPFQKYCITTRRGKGWGFPGRGFEGGFCKIWHIWHICILHFTRNQPCFHRLSLNFTQLYSSEMAGIHLSDINMQMRLWTLFELKYSKVFKFKGFNIISRLLQGDEWASGPMSGRLDWVYMTIHQPSVRNIRWINAWRRKGWGFPAQGFEGGFCIISMVVGTNCHQSYT